MPAEDPSDRVACGGREGHTAGGAAHFPNSGPAAETLAPDGPPPIDLELRERLTDPSAFDTDARLRKQFWPVLQKFREILEEHPDIQQDLDGIPWDAGSFASAIGLVVKVSHGQPWVLCSLCEGQGQDASGEVCGECGGSGFLYE
jgi:hypothetical protein